MVEEWLKQSSLYREGFAVGLAEARAEARLDFLRKLCVACTRKSHPGVLKAALPVITACSEPARLEQWALTATDVDEAGFRRLLGLPARPGASRRSPRKRR